MFWSIGFLLLPENAPHLAAIRKEIAAAAAEEAAAARAAAGSGAAGGPGSGGGGEAPTTAAAAALRAALVRLALDRRSHASRCVAESIRLRVHSIAIRLAGGKGIKWDLPPAVATGSSSGSGGGSSGEGERQGVAGASRQLRVPPGTVLAICPFVSHHDDALFGGGAGSPWAFDPGRAPIQLEPGAVATSTAGFGFGGGFWR
jgi:hypothetical protein